MLVELTSTGDITSICTHYRRNLSHLTYFCCTINIVLFLKSFFKDSHCIAKGWFLFCLLFSLTYIFENFYYQRSKSERKCFYKSLLHTSMLQPASDDTFS